MSSFSHACAGPGSICLSRVGQKARDAEGELRDRLLLSGQADQARSQDRRSISDVPPRKRGGQRRAPRLDCSNACRSIDRAECRRRAPANSSSDQPSGCRSVPVPARPDHIRAEDAPCFWTRAAGRRWRWTGHLVGSRQSTWHPGAQARGAGLRTFQRSEVFQVACRRRRPTGPRQTARVEKMVIMPDIDLWAA